MKLLLFSDLQAHNYSPFATRLENGLNSRFADCLGILKQVRDVAKSEKVDGVVFGGDMYESRVKLDIDVLSAVWEALADIANCTDLSLLVGNHDQFTKIGGVHSLTPCKQFARVIDSPQQFALGAVRIAAHPHTTDTESLKAWLRSLPETDILLLHQTPNEAAAGPTGRKLSDGVDISDLPLDRVRRVFFGHIHKKQRLSEKVIVLGSSLQLTFGEAGEDKSLWILDTSDWSLREIPTNAPRFHKITALANDPNPLSLDFGLIDPASDFIRLVYDPCWENEASELKAKYPRIHLEQASDVPSFTSRASDFSFADDALLMGEYIDKNAGADLDPSYLLERALEFLTTS